MIEQVKSKVGITLPRLQWGSTLGPDDRQKLMAFAVDVVESEENEAVRFAMYTWFGKPGAENYFEHLARWHQREAATETENTGPCARLQGAMLNNYGQRKAMCIDELLRSPMRLRDIALRFLILGGHLKTGQ